MICEQPYRAVHKENDLQYVKRLFIIPLLQWKDRK